MTNSLGSRWRGFRRNEDGAAAVEFSIIAPVFFFLIMVIFQLGYIFVADTVMSNAVRDVGRLIRTGQVIKNGLSDAQFRANFCDRVDVVVNCDAQNLFLAVSTVSSFSRIKVQPSDAAASYDVDLTSPPLRQDGEFLAENAYEYGGNDSNVVLRAYYKLPVWHLLGGFSLEDAGRSDGTRLLTSFAIFKNERFQ